MIWAEGNTVYGGDERLLVRPFAEPDLEFVVIVHDAHIQMSRVKHDLDSIHEIFRNAEIYRRSKESMVIAKS